MSIDEDCEMSNRVTDSSKSVVLDVMRCEAEIDVTKLSIQKLISDVKSLSKGLEEDMLDRKWSFDTGGKRILSSPEDEARRMCEQIENNPSLLHDVKSLLHRKLSKLKMEADQLEQQLYTG